MSGWRWKGPPRALCQCVLFGAALACLVPAQAAERSFELNIAEGRLQPAQPVLRVDKGDTVRWRMQSQQAGELHLHAYRLQARLVPGQPAELAFTAHASGRFRLEWHADAEPKQSSGGHHAPPLAVLEVRPK